MKENLKEYIENALNIAWTYGTLEDADHKMWVIDQMVRALCGTEEEYANWVKEYEMPTSDRGYSWRTGIAP